MAQIINTNVMSLNAQRNLNNTATGLSTALQRLSSGLRVNSSMDDAAGLAILAASAQPDDDQGLAVLNAGASGYCHSHAPADTQALQARIATLEEENQRLRLQVQTLQELLAEQGQ